MVSGILVDEGEAPDLVNLDFNKAFNSVYHSIPGKQAAHVLDRYTLC